MKPRNIPFAAAAGFFILWLGILLAGADFPPPRGFIWTIALDLAVAFTVYLRARTYAGWAASRKRFRLLRASLDGLIAGMTVALVMLLGPGGEPSVQPTLTDRLILVAVVGTLGAVNAPLVYGAVSFLARRSGRKNPA